MSDLDLLLNDKASMPKMYSFDEVRELVKEAVELGKANKLTKLVSSDEGDMYKPQDKGEELVNED